MHQTLDQLKEANIKKPAYCMILFISNVQERQIHRDRKICGFIGVQKTTKTENYNH